MSVAADTTEVKDLKDDIASLEEEIANLSADKKLLLEQIKRLENNQDTTDDSEPILKHKYFDEVVQEYFSTDASNPKSKAVDTSKHSKPKRRKLDVDELHSALVENIYRFGGITAFPINKYLFANDDNILGIRFETYNLNKFSTPHYAILRKVKNEKDETASDSWTVYKHTLPVFVPIHQYEQQYLSVNNITGFVKATRNFLLEVQYKHSKFDMIRKGFGFNVEKDLQCQRVKVHKQVNLPDGQKREISIQLVCSESYVGEVEVTSSHYSKKQLRIVESMLKNCPITDLVKTFRLVKDIIQPMLTNKIKGKETNSENPKPTQ